MHAKGEFGLDDAHLISRHRSGAAIRNHRLGEDASRHRAIDIDMPLPGFAGGCDFPAEQSFGGVIFDSRLDRVTFGTVAWTLRRFEARELGAGTPVVVQGPRCSRYLILAEHCFCSPGMAFIQS